MAQMNLLAKQEQTRRHRIRLVVNVVVGGGREQEGGTISLRLVDMNYFM